MLTSIYSSLFQFNFVGRILGPRGMTAKQLEQDTGCKIMVRGKGSMRDKKKVSDIYTLLNICHAQFESHFGVMAFISFIFSLPSSSSPRNVFLFL